MFHSVGRIMGWAKNYRKRMILGFVCSFFATWCTAGPVMLAAWALGRMIGNAWGENELSGSLPWLCLSGIVVLILLRFFFTYWPGNQQPGIAYHPNMDFRITPSRLAEIGAQTGWKMTAIGDWNHPRQQLMMLAEPA